MTQYPQRKADDRRWADRSQIVHGRVKTEVYLLDVSDARVRVGVLGRVSGRFRPLAAVSRFRNGTSLSVRNRTSNRSKESRPIPLKTGGSDDWRDEQRVAFFGHSIHCGVLSTLYALLAGGEVLKATRHREDAGLVRSELAYDVNCRPINEQTSRIKLRLKAASMQRRYWRRSPRYRLAVLIKESA